MIQQDYIMRLIKQAAAAIARMLNAGESGDYDDAQLFAEDAYDSLGVPRDLMVRMDSTSLAKLVKHPAKIRMLSKLSWAEGEILHSKGDPIHGLDRQRRAVELLLEAQHISPLPEDAAALQEMFRHVPTNLLHQRYQQKNGVSS